MFRTHRLLVLTATILALLSSYGTASAANKAYITNYNTDQVYVLDPLSRQLRTPIDTGHDGPWGIVISGTGAYVTNTSGDTVTVIDSTDNQVITTITVGSNPYDIATSGTGVYVVNGFSNNVSVIDTTTLTVDKTISVGLGPIGIGISGTGAYVTNATAGTVSLIDITNNVVERTITVGSGAYDVAFSGTGAFVTNLNADNVSVIDTTNGAVERTISVGDGPVGIAITGTGAYVANREADTVSVIDTTNFVVERTIAVGDNPEGITMNGTGAYVTNRVTDTISLIDTTNFAVEYSITGFDQPIASAFFTDDVTGDPTFSIPSTATGCSPTLHVTYSLPEAAMISTIHLQFYHVPSHSGATLTLADSASGDFIVTLHDVTASADILSVSPNHWSASDGAYIVYFTYQDAYGNDAASVDLPLTITTSCSSSSSSSSSSGGGGGGGGGTRTYGSSSSVNIETRSFTGGASSSSSSSSSSGASHGAAPAENALCQSWDVSASFTDVAANGWYECYVGSVVGLKIFEGYKLPDGTPKNLFGPGDNITLGQLAKVATILRNKEDLDPKPTGDEWYLPYIGAVQAFDASVFPPGIDPLRPATRAEVIQTILEALGIQINDERAPYDDVPRGHPFEAAISTATTLGFVSGDDGSDKFRPNEPINRAEVAKMLALALKHVGIVYEDDALPVSGSSSSSSSSSVAMVQTCTNKTPRAFPVRAQPTDSTAIVWHILAQQSARCEEANAGWWKLFGPNGEEGYVQKAMFVMSSAPSNQ
ncbi:MAG: S-layer homology domain-containing protein [Candidatus Peribacteraceae bacterium]|nr:S-layer homology domain-containing protein [Candidatus Peribacteraceae bacterium]